MWFYLRTGELEGKGERNLVLRSRKLVAVVRRDRSYDNRQCGSCSLSSPPDLRICFYRRTKGNQHVALSYRIGPTSQLWRWNTYHPISTPQPCYWSFTNLHIHVESPTDSIFDTIDTFHRSVTFTFRIAIVNNIGRRAVADCLYSKYTLWVSFSSELWSSFIDRFLKH